MSLIWQSGPPAYRKTDLCECGESFYDHYSSGRCMEPGCSCRSFRLDEVPGPMARIDSGTDRAWWFDRHVDAAVVVLVVFVALAMYAAFLVKKGIWQ